MVVKLYFFLNIVVKATKALNQVSVAVYLYTAIIVYVCQLLLKLSTV